jgi:hypothetical protein
MATPGELVKVIAATLGEDEATVTQHDRNLLIAGLRTKGGRGRSAAKVTPRDAAHVLTSVLGSHRVRDGVETVRRYMRTQEHRAHWFQHWPADKQQGMGPPNVWESFDIAELTALPPDHTFIDALTVLITLASEGRLIPHLKAPQGFGDLRIIVTSPRPHARISISRYRSKDDHKSVQADYGSNEPPPKWMTDKTGKVPPPANPTNKVNPRLDRWVEMDVMPLAYIGALLAGKIDEMPKIEG